MAVGGKLTSSNSGLQYVEQFTNPYVKIILVCKICNKEMSLKFSSNWKKHYLTHASNDEKPHKCDVCAKAFITLTSLRKHIQQKHPEHGTSAGDVSQQQLLKSEPNFYM